MVRNTYGVEGHNSHALFLWLVVVSHKSPPLCVLVQVRTYGSHNCLIPLALEPHFQCFPDVDTNTQLYFEESKVTSI